jgi:glycosyltransferase involved in cell wall biosynthesis
MSFMTLSHVPFYLEGLKEVPQPQNTILYGAGVVGYQFVKALLQHGKHERYYFLYDLPEMLYESENNLMMFPNRERAELVLTDEYWKLNHLDRMALFDPGTALTPLAGLRKLHGCAERPVTGLIHSISGYYPLLRTIQMILGDLYEYDCLVCSSLAGRQAVENILSSLCGYLERKYHRSFFPKFQLPVIPLAVDADQFLPGDKIKARRWCKLPEDHAIFLYVGRFATNYKMDLFPLILTFSRILATTSDKKVTLVLAGDDAEFNLSPRLRNFGADLGIAGNLQVRPNITNEEKRQLYASGDVFVSLSDNVQETFGITIIEAMSAGLPVIGSDWNGYKETIEHGKTGFLVPAYWADCVGSVSRSVMFRHTMEIHRQLAEAVSIDLKSLAYYIDLLLKNPSLRQEMGEAARKRVLKYYNWPVIIKAYEELWAGLTEQARHRSADEEIRYGIDAYDHLSVFRHFATGVITKDSRLQITSMGRECLNKTLNIRVLNSTELVRGWQKLAEILSIFGSEESIVVTDLIQKAGGENEHVNNEVFRQAARLIKYGLLEVC